MAGETGGLAAKPVLKAGGREGASDRGGAGGGCGERLRPAPCEIGGEGAAAVLLLGREDEAFVVDGGVLVGHALVELGLVVLEGGGEAT